MPKAVRFYETGGPEVLKIEEVLVPEPKQGEVKLRVQAIGLNRAESMFYHDRYLYPPKFPAGLGYEAAGIIESVGPGVDKSWIGKQISTIPISSLNDYSTVGEEVIARIEVIAEYPNSLPPIEGTAIWMQYITAYGALIAIADLRKDDFVVVSAASSSVGLAAIQIAKAQGAISIATTRKGDKKEELLALGADHVLATEEENFVDRVREITGDKGVRVAFDPIAGPFLEQLAEVASREGIIVEYGALSPEATPYPLFVTVSKGLTVRGYTLMEITRNPEKLAVAKKYVYDNLASGVFRPKVAKTFPFAQVIDAYRYLESNTQVGKIVVTVP